MFQVQIKFSDALVIFTGAPRAKNDVALPLGEVVKPYWQPALHGNKVDYVYHAVDAGEMFAADDAAKQRLRGPAIARGILAERPVAGTRRGNGRGLQDCARIGIFQNARFA